MRPASEVAREFTRAKAEFYDPELAALIEQARAESAAEAKAERDELERAMDAMAQLVEQGNAGNVGAFGDGLAQGHKNGLAVIRAPMEKP